ncbi:MAG TPA: hypothetical protein ENK47_07060 [Euryarchaeota archaeon]|nr:MAG: hypothetical protein B6U90_06655 [Thermoplasmatales archaeon ex4484_6]RLF67068.1 MAG: hypothetical protein DRN57_06035 [Thermoplasmata archaeon]HHD16452.1 hypothetical protein [Euryarchaeota archaeon]
MLKEFLLEDTLLNGFEFPVAMVIEVTKQGIVLSKMRYLKAVGDIINQTIRCPMITMYAHMGSFRDPHLNSEVISPMGVDLIYMFQIDKQYFNETVEAIKRGRATLNFHNPQTQEMAKVLMEKIMRKDRINFRRLSAQEQGLILEPYIYYMLQRVGEGKRNILQNVELLEREGVLKCEREGDIIRYRPAPAPTMEVDIMMFTDMKYIPSILRGLESHGFKHEIQFG